jgi:hypothetical protein
LLREGDAVAVRIQLKYNHRYSPSGGRGRKREGDAVAVMIQLKYNHRYSPFGGRGRKREGDAVAVRIQLKYNHGGRGRKRLEVYMICNYFLLHILC